MGSRVTHHINNPDDGDSLQRMAETSLLSVAVVASNLVQHNLNLRMVHPVEWLVLL